MIFWHQMFERRWVVMGGVTSSLPSVDRPRSAGDLRSSRGSTHQLLRGLPSDKISTSHHGTQTVFWNRFYFVTAMWSSSEERKRFLSKWNGIRGRTIQIFIFTNFKIFMFTRHYQILQCLSTFILHIFTFSSNFPPTVSTSSSQISSTTSTRISCYSKRSNPSQTQSRQKSKNTFHKWSIGQTWEEVQGQKLSNNSWKSRLCQRTGSDGHPSKNLVPE